MKFFRRTVMLRKDYLINNGANNLYFLVVVALVSLIGAIFVFHILPAYDPSTLAQPYPLVFWEYFGLFLGGVGVFVSFFFRDRILGLKVQFWALLIQTIAIYAALISAMVASLVFFGGLQASLFIMLWGITFGFIHTTQLFQIKRERHNAPAKRELGEKLEPVIETSGARADLMLQALLTIQKKNEELEDRLIGYK
jgi:hypothetical protein